jgi:hypothetical protein
VEIQERYRQARGFEPLDRTQLGWAGLGTARLGKAGLGIKNPGWSQERFDSAPRGARRGTAGRGNARCGRAWPGLGSTAT